MEELLSFVIQVFGELLLQLLLELLSEIGVRTFTGMIRPTHTGPWMAFAGYLLLGAVIGVISLHFLPHHLITSPGGRLANLVVTPLLAGGFMMRLGNWRAGKDQDLIRLDEFVYGFCFALEIALIRFFFTKI
jgi:hypothetical protein